MARCSRCGLVETSLYINDLPVCLDCSDKETQQSLDSPWITGLNQRRNPPKKVQSIEDSKPTTSTIHIVGAKRR